MTTPFPIAFVSALAFVAVLSPFVSIARADSTVLLEGEVPTDGDYFVLPFEVPAGTSEIEIRHDDLSETNILDWGVLSPEGFRGYGGGNTEPAITNPMAASRSYLPGPITAGTWHVYVGKARVTELPARYRVEVLLRDVATLAPQPERAPYTPTPALVSEARWYAGDFHVHSRESGDASPSLDEVLDFAESRGLELVMLSEHNTTSQLERYADVQARHPTVLLVPGIEVTTYEGHAMSMGGTTWIDHRIGFEGRTMDQVVRDVHDDEALFSLNHPALDIGDLCIGCGWMAMAAPEGIDAMEIQTGAYSVTGRLFFRSASSMWDDLVMAGHHVVAVGGSDDHRAGTGTDRFDSPIGSPTTMVFARELSAAGILEGVRLGRTVVKLEGPDDPMIELDPIDLGDDTDTIVADRTSIVVRVTGATEGGTLRIVRDGVMGPPIEVVGTTFEHEEIVIAGAAESAIRAQLVIGGQPRVVTSHVFVRPRTEGGPDAGLAPDAGGDDAGPEDDAAVSDDAGTSPPAAGCGCRASTSSRAGSTAGLAAFVVVLLARRRRRLVLCLVLAVSGCGAEEASTSEGTPRETELFVFAATSLRDAFTTMERRFETAHPGVEVTLQLAGTPELRAQIEAGAPADVLASADVASMDALRSAGRVGEVTIFARNEPVLVVSREARARVTSFADLPRVERVVLGAAEVPIGRYSATILDHADRAIAPDFRARVEAHVVSREPNVRQVLARVAMGEAEAGIVYRTDVRGADDDLGVIAIPTEVGVMATYPIAPVEGAAHPTLARAWIALVLGAEGREILADAGFLAAEAP